MNFDFGQIAHSIKDGAYPFIGSGSGRRVYDLQNGYVAKVARNARGIAQNEAEYHIARKDASGLFAEVAAVSGDLRTLIMERADRIADISAVWSYFHVKSNDQLYRLKVLREASAAHSLLLPDLGRYQNWGWIGNRLVVIDYGFTRSVRAKYYFR